jgi:glycosyltransferase involved in cell wall biosynthesis
LAREARLLQQCESATLQRTVGVVALTPEDARRFETLGARTPATVVPPWVTPPAWQWRASGSSRLLLVGSFTWHAKRANAIWLATVVFPRVRSAVPNAELWLVGKGASLLGPGLSGVEGVHLRSDVPSTAEFLQQAAVFVNPERQESGIKLKTLEAAAAGLPIVSTPAGVEGTGLGQGASCMVAEDADAFVTAAVELLRSRDRAAALGDAARGIVLDRFSRARFDERLGVLLAGIAT